MTQKKVRLRTLAKMVKGEICGDDDIFIHNFAPLESAGEGELSFLVKANRVDLLDTTNAAAVLVPMQVTENDIPLIRVHDPNLAGAIIHGFLLEKSFDAKGIHVSAVIGAACKVSDNVSVGANAVIGDRVTIGTGVTLEPGVVVGDDVSIGNGTTLKANVTIEHGCKLGNRVTIHPGSVIGSDGYGYAADENGCHIKRPQVGIVQIDDDVEIGANTCIDRATFGVTWIKSGVKIDNLVQVAHNVIVGENSLLVAGVGIAGSATLGRNVVLGGNVSVKGHIHLGDGVMVAATGGVHNSQPKGAIIGGAPAIPIKQFVKAATIFAKLPEIWKELKQLKNQMKSIQEKCDKEGQKGERE